jgi:hypothetical protein
LGYLFFLLDSGLLEKQALELHVLRLLVLLLDGGLLENKHRSFTYSFHWTVDYWKNRHSTQTSTVLKLLVLLLDGGLTGGRFTGSQHGSKAFTCLCIQTFRGEDFSMIPTEYYSGYLYNFKSMMSSVVYFDDAVPWLAFPTSLALLA